MRSASAVIVVRSAVRRDRLLVGAWVAVLVGLVYASAAATTDLYPDPADRVRAAEAIDRSTALVALYGPILDPRSVGELAMTKLTVLYALAVAALALVLVRRHTRSEEEDGRAELLASTALRRRSLLTGAVLWAGAVTLAVGALATGASLLGGLPARGSVLFGASWAGVGLVGVGLTAVAAQVASTARATAALTLGVLAAAYALRALGDVVDGGGALGWISPLGWTTRLRAWSEPRWWVLLLWPLLALVLLGVARVLEQRRDLGAGLIGERLGPADGVLAGPWSLAWRTYRASLLGWTFAMVATGAVTGALAPGVGDLLDTGTGRDVLRTLGGRGALEEALLAAIFAFAGIAVAGWGITIVARSAADDARGRSELLLATSVRREDAARVTVVAAMVPPLLLLAVAGVSATLVLAVGDGGGLLGRARQVLPLAVAPWPAAVVIIGIALVGGAWWRRGPTIGWSALAGAVILEDLGPLLDLPAPLARLSPFAHVPTSGDVVTGAQAAMTLIGALLALAAVRRFARRDLG